MIKLITETYCQNCECFEPEVTKRPEKIRCRDIMGGNDVIITKSDTIVKCMHRDLCKRIASEIREGGNEPAK